jgi:hypothetical protein
MVKKQKPANKKAVIATRVFIAIFTVIAIVGIFFFARSISEKHTLIHTGEQAVGVVIKQDTDIHTNRSGSFTSRTMSYSFTPEDSKQKITKSEFNVSKKEYENYPQASAIQITYLPSDPSINQPTVSLRHIPVMSVLVIYLIGIFIASYICTKIGKVIRKKYNIKKKQSYWNMPIALVAVAIIVAMGMCFAAIISKSVTVLFL